MIIGIISDTHGHLPREVLKVFAGVKHIFHAGDIGHIDVITELEVIAPVSAIFGNIDSSPLTNNFPPNFTTKLNGRIIHLVHNIGNIKSYSFIIFKKNLNPDVVIFGHTHRKQSEFYQGVLYLNPGSVSFPRLSSSGTVALLDLSKPVLDAQFIEIKKADVK